MRRHSTRQHLARVITIAITLLTAPTDATSETGETLDRHVNNTAELCKVCHAGDVRTVDGYVVPSLAGQNLEYMLKALGDLANGTRPAPTGMRSMARYVLAYRSQQFKEELLVHMAKQPVLPSPPESVDETDFAAGKELAEKDCAFCHGIDGIATHLFPNTPNIAGQRRAYIEQELKYLQGENPARKTPGTDSKAHQLISPEIRDVAAYYSGIKRDSNAPVRKW